MDQNLTKNRTTTCIKFILSKSLSPFFISKDTAFPSSSLNLYFFETNKTNFAIAKFN